MLSMTQLGELLVSAIFVGRYGATTLLSARITKMHRLQRESPRNRLRRGRDRKGNVV
jgi:hypothetical protein